MKFLEISFKDLVGEIFINVFQKTANLMRNRDLIFAKFPGGLPPGGSQLAGSAFLKKRRKKLRYSRGGSSALSRFPRIAPAPGSVDAQEGPTFQVRTIFRAQSPLEKEGTSANDGVHKR